MKRIVSINGSPRGKKATSHTILKHLNERVKSPSKEIYSLLPSQKTGYEKLMDEIQEATDVIIAFPLYVDSIPALLQDFMENYNEEYKNGKISGNKNLYVIINCGFPEAEHNMTAMAIMKEFARTSGFKWMSGLGIGMGGMINPENIPPTVKMVRPVYDRLYRIANEINGDYRKKGKEKASYISPHINMLGKKIMKVFYNFMGNQGWKKQAGKNGVVDKLGARPYIIDNV
jgi:multimeric flavodoxin WrbA